MIDAIINFINSPVENIRSHRQANNRANAVGDALESYVADLFAGTVNVTDENERNERISRVFSYTGNATNPPDMMIRGGDAIEVKKLKTTTQQIQLNSSYPKQKLYSTSRMISRACREAETWDVKDMIYAVGAVTDEGRLNSLVMVYGLDYCAEEECYSRIGNIIRDGVNSIPGIEFAETNELGRINRVDPLGITSLRVRGMWIITNPWDTFNYLVTNPPRLMCIINEDKWAQLDRPERLYEYDQLTIADVRIKNPDNPAQLRNAKLITTNGV